MGVPGVHGGGNGKRLFLRMQDDAGGRVVLDVWFWPAWRELGRAVAAVGPDDLELDPKTVRNLGYQPVED